MELDSRPCRGQFGCVDLCSSYEIDGTHAMRLDGGGTQECGQVGGEEGEGLFRVSTALCGTVRAFNHISNYQDPRGN